MRDDVIPGWGDVGKNLLGVYGWESRESKGGASLRGREEG